MLFFFNLVLSQRTPLKIPKIPNHLKRSHSIEIKNNSDNFKDKYRTSKSTKMHTIFNFL